MEDDNKVPIVFDILKSSKAFTMEKSKYPFITVNLKNGSIFFNLKSVRELEMLPGMKVCFSADVASKKAFFYFDSTNANGHLLREAGDTGTLRVCSKNIVAIIKEVFFADGIIDSNRLYIQTEKTMIYVRDGNKNKAVMAYELSNLEFIKK